MYDKNLKTFIIAMLKYFVLWVTYMIYLYALFCKIATKYKIKETENKYF